MRFWEAFGFLLVSGLMLWGVCAWFAGFFCYELLVLLWRGHLGGNPPEDLSRPIEPPLQAPLGARAPRERAARPRDVA